MSTRILDQTHHGTGLDVDDGDTVEVRLPANASTGYQWSVTALPDGLQLVDDQLDVRPGANPGAAGEHRFRFSVHGVAQGELALELRRPWERLDRPEDRFAVRLASRSARGSATPAG
jgi:inhibitor of cysteine peptidase